VPKFTCSYNLDDRLDRDLVNLTQGLYRFIPVAIKGSFPFKAVRTRLVDVQYQPEPAQIWLASSAVLAYGCADAALTLTLHNLGREAEVLGRQVFEHVLRAYYYVQHRRTAKHQFELAPFRELRLLRDLGYDRRKKRYRDLIKFCDAVKKSRPKLATMASGTAKEKTKGKEPDVMTMLGRKTKRAKYTYALWYRVPSQLSHGTVLGMTELFDEQGRMTMDSRLTNPNRTLVQVSANLILLIELLNREFRLHQDSAIKRFKAEFQRLQPLIVNTID